MGASHSSGLAFVGRAVKPWEELGERGAITQLALRTLAGFDGYPIQDMGQNFLIATAKSLWWKSSDHNAVYPSARLNVHSEGIVVHPTPPHVQRRPLP